MKWKILLGSTAAVLLVGIAIAAAWWLNRPQTILLKDGAKLTLIGVTCGKHHVPPGVKIAGKQNRNDMAFDTESNSIVVWIESETKKKGPNHSPNYQLFVCDRAETACVSTWARRRNDIKDGVSLQGFPIDAFPRWDRKIVLRVGAWNNRGGGMEAAKGEFVVSNPELSRAATQWTPEPVPDTQSDGDLNVTLTKLNCGVPGFNSGRGVSSRDPMNKAVFAAFHCEQKGVTVTNWEPVGIETSDACGNHIQNNSWSTSRDGHGDVTMTYQWGLWPDKAPWKLRVEMSRTSGFNNDETWTVENVPVQAGSRMDFWNYNSRRETNAPFAETTLNGVHLKLYPATQFTDQNFNGQKAGGFRVIADPPPPEGCRMTLARAVDEQGRAIQSWNPSWGGGNYGFQLQTIRNAKFLNLTLALHKSRFVEFTVTPAKQ